ncbi:MAG: M15 family metallopeptidase [Chloroflexi bacterium]|nr:M15 family metallopeptidase [Chloroflexota bacterium]
MSMVLVGCAGQVTAVTPITLPPPPTETVTAVPLSATPTIKSANRSAPANTPTPFPTTTFTPTPAATNTPTATPTATPIGPCDGRKPYNDLLAVVTKTYGLSRNFAPSDLVPLADYFSNNVTLGYPTEVRAIIVEPLVMLIADMEAVGLRPQILSGYRSYSAQSIAFDKWLNEFPDWATNLSAPPGHSEHQLGTTIDFGSLELPQFTGDPKLQFHTYFYMTSEGIWLLENAHKYGFTLSYPREATDLTGFYYEPWHYRYVGVEMATQLKEMGLSLAELQLINQTIEPCVPDHE